MYARTARAGAATVISNRDSDRAVWYFFYDAVNAASVISVCAARKYMTHKISLFWF